MQYAIQLMRERWMLLMTALLAPVVGVLVAEEMNVVLANIDYVGVGPSAPWIRFAVGLFVTWRIFAAAYEQWTNEKPAMPWMLFARQLAAYLVVLPTSILIGRILFLYIPPWDPLVGAVIAPLLAYYFLSGVAMPNSASNTSEFRRGARALSLEQAQGQAVALQQGQNEFLEWAGLRLPASVSEGHFCVVGAPGTGKTLLIRSLMASVLPQIAQGTDRRAIVYDVKLDAVSELNTMGLQCPLRILNPFDTRCHAWDMAADLKDPDGADQYAAILFPYPPGDKEQFFVKAARQIVAGILTFFIITKRDWTLRDLILVAARKTRLQQALEATPYTADLIDEYFTPEDTFQNIRNTIANSLGRLRSVAAIWHALPPERRFTIDHWCKKESSIIVLGRQFDRRDTLTLLNQILFQRIAEVLLSGEESPTRWKTWFFIDELKEGGQLEGLPELLTNGRSKGARIAVGFQDIEGLRNTYGEHIANEMPGMCANRSILHLRSSFTAQWASDQLGEVENFEYVTSFGTSRDKDGNITSSNNTTKNIETRRAILPSEFMSFALSKGGHVYGCHIIPALDGFVGRTTQHPLHDRITGENFSPRTDSNEMLLAPWTAEDDRRMGFGVSTVAEGGDDLPSETAQPQPEKSPLDQMGRMFRGRFGKKRDSS